MDGVRDSVKAVQFIQTDILRSWSRRIVGCSVIKSDLRIKRVDVLSLIQCVMSCCLFEERLNKRTRCDQTTLCVPRMNDVLCLNAQCDNYVMSIDNVKCSGVRENWSRL